MNLDVAQFLPEDFSPESRVWIYQSSRLFTMGEALDMEPMLEEFAASWKSHGAQVKAFANLLYGQFIILMADETMAGVSGCSTDSSVRFVKQIEEKYRVNLFDRQTLAFIIKDKVQMLPLSQLNYAVENNFVTPDTLYFNNLAATKAELISNWIVPVKQSWLGKRLNMQEA